MRNAPPALRFWMKTALVLLGLFLLLTLSVYGGYWWLYGKDLARDSSLDSVLWQTATVNTPPKEDPRRDMVQATQRWLSMERPDRESVRARLGKPDFSTVTKSGGEDGWHVGCFTQAFSCTNGDTLLVSYPGKRATSRVVSTVQGES